MPTTDSTYAHVGLTDSSFTIDTKPASPIEGEHADAYDLLSDVIRGTFFLSEPRHELRSTEPSITIRRLGTTSTLCVWRLQRCLPTRIPHGIQYVYGKARLTLSESDSKHFPLWTAITLSGPDRHVCIQATAYVQMCLLTLDTVNKHTNIDGLIESAHFFTNLIVAASHSPIESLASPGA